MKICCPVICCPVSDVWCSGREWCWAGNCCDEEGMFCWRPVRVGRAIITGCRVVDVVAVRAPAEEVVCVAVAYNVERAGDGGM